MFKGKNPEVITAPESYKIRDIQTERVFLAGSIEMNSAEKWQDRLISSLNADIIFNPRRKEWDSSWEQNMNSKNFYEQVTWELDALDNSTLIALYFDPNTKSPISLLELGLYARTGKLIVCCPDGFWRKGNVDIVCKKYGIPLFTDWNTWVFEIQREINK